MRRRGPQRCEQQEPQIAVVEGCCNVLLSAAGQHEAPNLMILKVEIKHESGAWCWLEPDVNDGYKFRRKFKSMMG